MAKAISAENLFVCPKCGHDVFRVETNMRVVQKPYKKGAVLTAPWIQKVLICLECGKETKDVEIAGKR